MKAYYLTQQEVNLLRGENLTDEIFFNILLDKDNKQCILLSNSDIEVLPQEYDWIKQLPQSEYVPPINTNTP